MDISRHRPNSIRKLLALFVVLGIVCASPAFVDEVNAPKNEGIPHIDRRAMCNGLYSRAGKNVYLYSGRPSDISGPMEVNKFVWRTKAPITPLRLSISGNTDQAEKSRVGALAKALNTNDYWHRFTLVTINKRAFFLVESFLIKDTSPDGGPAYPFWAAFSSLEPSICYLIPFVDLPRDF